MTELDRTMEDSRQAAKKENNQKSVADIANMIVNDKKTKQNNKKKFEEKVLDLKITRILETKLSNLNFYKNNLQNALREIEDIKDRLKTAQDEYDELLDNGRDDFNHVSLHDNDPALIRLKQSYLEEDTINFNPMCAHGILPPNQGFANHPPLGYPSSPMKNIWE